jgi:transposase
VGLGQAVVARAQRGRPAGEAPATGDRILYLVRSGCPWRCLPADLPPWQTVYWYFVRWEDAGVTEKLLAALPVTARVAQGREPEPSAGVLDSQSVKGADTVGKDSRGYDAGQWGSGRSRRQRDSRRSCRSALVCCHGEQNRGAGDGTSLMERLTGRVLLLGPTSAFEVCCGRSQRDRLGSSPLRRWAERGPAATRPRQRWPSPCRVRPRPSRQVAISGWPAPSAASVMVESCPV